MFIQLLATITTEYFIRTILFLILTSLSSTVFSQEIYSKYPSNSSDIYDVLLTGARYSENELNTKYNIQVKLLEQEEFKKISGNFYITFVVGCDGKTTDLKYNFPVCTIQNQIIKDMMISIAKENNWIPAIHRNERFPHRKRIGIAIKKGKIKDFYL